LLLAALTVPACQSSSTPLPYIPITGIVVPSAKIVAGYGCGTGPGQVYKYAVVVSEVGPDGGPKSPISVGVFDCFADGVIENLDAGSMNYVLSIYAYNQAGYPTCLVGVCDPPDASYAGGPCFPAQGADPAMVASVAGQFAAAAQWQTTCTASQQQGAPTSASCGPLEVPPAPADGGPTTSFVCDASPGPDSGDDGSSGDAPANVVKPDASTDGAPDADAGAGADAAVGDATDATVGDQASPTDATVDVATD
jgi:hypothetical protein